MKKISKAILFGLAAAMTILTGCSGGEGNSETTASAAASENTIKKKTVKLTYEIDSSKPVIALTFDDGPNTTTTNQVLDKLEKYQVRASFFLVGNNISDASADSAKRAFDLGCEINNHSKTHSVMNQMTAEDIKAEIEFTDAKILEITSEKPKFFRPPYIAVNDTMLDCIDETFIAGIGAEDWVATVTAEQRAQKILDQVKDGSIILLHDAQGNTPTVDALDILIPKLQEMGYQFATVSELFNAKGIEITADDKKVYSNALQTAQY